MDIERMRTHDNSDASNLIQMRLFLLYAIISMLLFVLVLYISFGILVTFASRVMSIVNTRRERNRKKII